MKLKIGITHGDMNGIGYEVLLKAFEDPAMLELFTPVIYGSAKAAHAYRKSLGLPDIRFNIIDSPEAAQADKINLINVVQGDPQLEVGTPTEASGKAALAALEAAARDINEGLIDALVTCPISKEAIHSEEFAFPGHTEWLEARTARPDSSDKAMMIMCGQHMRVALVTIHEPISEVAAKITSEKVTDAIAAFAQSLTQDFGVHAPRIAVLALDPHAGDGGVIGSEDKEVIAPAVAEAYKKKILAFGPYPADGFFGSGAYKKFDGILAMYHDQGLIPFKLIEAEQGVNFTAGLPVVRTSPDHGTAFDIAGKGVADASSLREAIYAAIDICRNRAREAEATRNPLRKQHFDRGSDRLPKEKDA